MYIDKNLHYHLFFLQICLKSLECSLNLVEPLSHKTIKPCALIPIVGFKSDYGIMRKLTITNQDVDKLDDKIYIKI